MAVRIDAHTHITNTSLLRYPWGNASAGTCPCAPLCLCDWTPAQWAAATAAARLDAFVFLEVGADPDQYAVEAAWVQGVADAGAPVAAIVARSPPGFGTPGANASALAAALAALLREVPLLRGVRADGVDWSDPAAVQALTEHAQLLADLDLSLDIIPGDVAGGVAGAIAGLARAVPALRLVVDHMGGGWGLTAAADLAAWAAALRVLAGPPNVFIKIGGVQGLGGGGATPLPTLENLGFQIEHSIAAFGFDRSLFESNWFFINYINPPDMDVFPAFYNVVIGALDAMNATLGQREALFGAAAVRAYRIQ
jgi:L-fuconolactonase